MTPNSITLRTQMFCFFGYLQSIISGWLDVCDVLLIFAVRLEYYFFIKWSKKKYINVHLRTTAV